MYSLRYKASVITLSSLISPVRNQFLSFHLSRTRSTNHSIKMATPTPLPPITLSLAGPPDFYSITALEAYTFYGEEFSAVAFGPKRDFPENLALREKTLASQPKEKGSVNKVVKAVINVDGKEEIVGAAGWTLTVGREETETDEVKVDGDGEGKLNGDGEKNGGNEGEYGSKGWGEGANVKLCEDIFLGADAHMMRSTEGKDYASEVLPFFEPMLN
jgi:hypothetical protein